MTLRWRKPTTFVAMLLIGIIQSACTTLKPPTLPQPFDDDYTPIISYLSEYIPQQMKAGKLTGLSIALVKDQNVLWSEGFGVADKAQDLPASSQTRYRAGSVSKLFNAYAIMKLVEEGKLELDLPVANYIPEFSVNSRFGSTDDITLRTLLSHQSGLPSDIVNEMWSKNPPPMQSLLAQVRDSYTISPANTVFNYSNVGVSVSGLAVQSVTGMPYDQHMKDDILQPLGMDDSDFTGRLEGDRAASGYIDGKLVAELPLRDLAAGGLNSTVGDLAKFVMALHAEGKLLIGESSFKQMREVQNNGNPLDFDLRMGLGWFIEKEPVGDGYDVLWHGGRTMAHTTSLSTAPDVGIGVVIMANSADTTDALSRIATQAMQQLYATTGLPKGKVADTDKASVVETLVTSNDLAGQYAGNFGLISIESDDDRFSAEALGLTFSLRPEPGDWYSPRIMLWVIPLRPKEFETLEVTRSYIDGKHRLIGRDANELFLLGDLVDPYPATAQWDKYLGEYEIQNPIEIQEWSLRDIYFKRAEDFYYLQITGAEGVPMISPVLPLDDGQFILLGTGRGLGGTATSIGQAGDIAFRSSGLIYKRIAELPESD